MRSFEPSLSCADSRQLTSLTALGVLLLAMGMPARVAGQGDEGSTQGGFTRTEVEFHNGDVSLAGSLILPTGPPPHPAIVFLHGSGPMTRAGALNYAERYAGFGFAGLAFDKRGTGESTGAWTSASLADLARDAVAAIDYLAARDDVDAGRIGFWGVSQAGWVATQATQFTKDIGFMVVISGGGVTPYESEMFSYRTAFEQAGLAVDDKAAGIAVISDYFHYLGSGEGRDKVEAGIAEATESPWFEHARLDRILPSNEEGRRTWSWVADWDPRPLMETITFPTLLLFGERDTQTPAALSAERWRQSLEKAGNDQFTIRMFPEAGHAIRLGHHGAAVDRPPFAEGYHETLDAWLEAMAAGAS